MGYISFINLLKPVIKVGAEVSRDETQLGWRSVRAYVSRAQASQESLWEPLRLATPI